MRTSTRVPAVALLVGLSLVAGCTAKGSVSPRDGATLDQGPPWLDIGRRDGPVVDPDGPVQHRDAVVWDGNVPVQDAGPVKDSKPAKDATPVADKTPPDLPGPSAIQIVVTEIMANPAAVSDTNGEWIELFNPGSLAVDLSGWTLKDDGADSHQIVGPLAIGPGQYVVLARKSDSLINGGVSAVYQYQGFLISNDDDEVTLLDDAGLLVDRVAYTTTWDITSGASLQLKDPALDNNDPTNWCLAAAPWSGSAGDSGTPGAPTVCP